MMLLVFYRLTQKKPFQPKPSKKRPISKIVRICVIIVVSVLLFMVMEATIAHFWDILSDFSSQLDQGTDHQNSQALSYVTLASNPTHLSQTPHPICRVYNHRLWFPVEQPTQQSSNWNWLKSYHCVNSVIKENHWLYVQFQKDKVWMIPPFPDLPMVRWIINSGNHKKRMLHPRF